MTSGGYRQPNPAKGGKYPNRSDMRTTQPVQTQTGQPYGVAGQQQAALKAVPLQNTNPVAAAESAGGPPQGPMPSPLNHLNTPSGRPGEPITTGIPIGAGAGPEALAMSTQVNDNIANQLRAVYKRYPTEGLRILLEQLDS